MRALRQVFITFSQERGSHSAVQPMLLCLWRRDGTGNMLHPLAHPGPKRPAQGF